MYNIQEELLKKVIQYLGTKPAAETLHLLNALLALKPATETQHGQQSQEK
jgi:hypothetical protein